jgi:hypothetical protein
MNKQTITILGISALIVSIYLANKKSNVKSIVTNNLDEYVCDDGLIISKEYNNKAGLIYKCSDSKGNYVKRALYNLKYNDEGIVYQNEKGCPEGYKKHLINCLITPCPEKYECIPDGLIDESEAYNKNISLGEMFKKNMNLTKI